MFEISIYTKENENDYKYTKKNNGRSRQHKNLFRANAGAN